MKSVLFLLFSANAFASWTYTTGWGPECGLAKGDAKARAQIKCPSADFRGSYFDDGKQMNFPCDESFYGTFDNDYKFFQQFLF